MEAERRDNVVHSHRIVLNADGDGAGRYATSQDLRKAGFTVLEAGTVEDALRGAAEQPDLVLLDVTLPESGGFEVCRRLRADPTTGSIPVLLCSPVFVSSADRVRGLESGADGFLNGPVETAELVATVNALLRLRQVTGRCDATRRGRERAKQESARREPAEGLQLVPWPEQEFHGFLEAAPDAVVIADRDGRIIRVNAQAEKLFGYPRAELLGQEVEMLIPERFRVRHVGQRTAYSANPSARPMGTGQQLHGLRKDGHEFPAEISLSPLPTEDGFVIASAIRDVDRAQAHGGRITAADAGTGGRGSPQGRVPGDAGARAAQPPRYHSQRGPGLEATRSAGQQSSVGPGCHRPPGRPHDPPG